MTDLISSIESIATVAALIVGGLWAYFNFVSGRIYRPRIEPVITGRAFKATNGLSLVVGVQLTNSGLSKVDLEQRGSGFRVYQTTESADEKKPVLRPSWVRLGTYPIFTDHGWIESGETIREEHLVSIAKPVPVAFQLELRAVAHQVSFKSRSVVVVQTDSENNVRGNVPETGWTDDRGGSQRGA